MLDRAHFTESSIGAALCLLDVDWSKSKFGDLLEELGGERSTSRCLAESGWQHVFSVLEKQGEVEEGPVDQGTCECSSPVSVGFMFPWQHTLCGCAMTPVVSERDWQENGVCEAGRKSVSLGRPWL